MNHSTNKSFWMMGGFFLTYFFIMGIYFPFFPIWLSEKNDINPTNTGMIFASISLFSLLFQPILGLLSDKLGLRKHLLWLITIMLIFFAPFFIYILTPLLKYTVVIAAIIAGVYLGLVYNAGAPTIEAYIEKISRSHHFEFGKVRLFGCVGWSISATLVGLLFSTNPEIVFWLGSASALVLAVILAFANVSAIQSINQASQEKVSFRISMAFELFTQARIWYLTLFVIGVSCTYDVYDQQFANFFTSFFAEPQQGIRFLAT